jgi:phosphinothricin acetyltransferase
MDEIAFSVRTAKEEDATSVARVYAPYVRDTTVTFELEPPDPPTMARRIADTMEMYPWLVAENAAGEIVGYAYAGRHRERPAYRWTIDTTIYIDTAYRRARVGTKLYRSLLEILRRQGFRSAFAEIVLPNPGSVGLHERMGFNKIGIHHDVGFKLGAWCDIGYWRLGLASGTAPEVDPTPFSVFQQSPGLARALGVDANGSANTWGNEA